MKLGPHNEQAVCNLLAGLMAAAGEAASGIERMRSTRANASPAAVVVPKVNGDRATFREPGAEAEKDMRTYMAQAGRGLNALFVVAGALQQTLAQDPPQEQPRLKVV